MLFPPAIDRRQALGCAAAVQMSLRRVALLLLLGCAGLITSCSNVHITGTSPQPPAPPSGPPPVAGQTGTVTITPQYAAIAPGQTFQFSASSTNGGTIQWSTSGGGTIDQSGNFTAPASIAQSENVTVTAALASAAQQNNATAVVSVIQPGQIQCPTVTGNPQVAQYAVYLPAPGKASVEFGTSTNYGLNTWQLPSPSSNGGQVQLWVAGMLAKTTYHMRGQVVLDDGATFTDADQVCTTGKLPFPGSSPVTVTQMGRAPQPGIEMWNTVLPPTDTQLFATDLKGNVIWTYSYPHSASDVVQGVQLLPNGNLLMVISFLSSTNGANDPNIINEVREVDLAGNTVRSVTVNAVNQKLAAMHAADLSGTPYALKSFHHNVLALPNGHWVLLAAYAKGIPNVTGFPGNNVVLGDALIDVDQNGNPDWEWSIFDHLDPNRHPMNFPDWTHSNAMLYSADDHNLLLSVRHQNWILKIDFNDGTGSGKILWKLGYQGDFTLEGGHDPEDWFYAQHGMSYTTSNTTGIFGLMMMDNGNDRYLTPNQQLHCNPFAGGRGPTTLDPNCYSTMPVLSINENTMTATLIHNYKPGVVGTFGKAPATITGNSFFSFFGGNAEVLANGDYEVTFAATIGQAGIVQELDPNTLQPIWQANTPSADQYHVNRWPSLYPGVQW